MCVIHTLQRAAHERKHERAELQATKQALKSAVALAVREAPTSTKLWDLANALRQSGMISQRGACVGAELLRLTFQA